MVSNNSSRKLPKKKIAKKVTKKTVKGSTYPKVFKDKENGYISIKLKAGIETKSYLKSGILFLENEEGEVIEVQVQI